MDVSLSRIITELQLQNKMQYELTDYLGINYSSFANWKAGRNQSYKKYLHAISDFLDVSVEYLKGETDKKEKPSIAADERLKELYNLTDGLSESEILALKSFVAGLKASRPQD